MNVAVMGVHYMQHHGESDAGPANVARGRRATADEPPEDGLTLLRGDAGARTSVS
jgi:hypothetical protein